MGCGRSKLHPRYAEIYKLRRKYDTIPIRTKNLVHIWVLGALPGPVRELASSVANRCGFLLVSASDVTSSERSLSTERGILINTLLQDVGYLPSEVMTDLVTELLLAKIEETRGVVMIGVPCNKSQATSLEKLIGPVSMIIYMEIHCSVLRAKLLASGTDEVEVRNKLRSFYRNIIPLTKYKKAIKVNGEKDASICLEECKEHLDELSRV